ncbi:MAG: FG-GAP repeat protein, partial [Cyclobacteriaceae bacterium]|nr:FG-GAP repeat protein [Cyclobacteriaceae bacterium]
MNKLIFTIIFSFIFFQSFSQNWSQYQKIVASDRDASDNFGESISISGSYAIAGAPFEDNDSLGSTYVANSGSAYIFERNPNGDWMQVQKLTAFVRDTAAAFGLVVSINNKYAIVGAKNEDFNASGLNEESNAGAAYIFERDNNGNWNQAQKIVASDRSVG